MRVWARGAVYKGRREKANGSEVVRRFERRGRIVMDCRSPRVRRAVGMRCRP